MTARSLIRHPFVISISFNKILFVFFEYLYSHEIVTFNYHEKVTTAVAFYDDDAPVDVFYICHISNHIEIDFETRVLHSIPFFLLSIFHSALTLSPFSLALSRAPCEMPLKMRDACSLSHLLPA